MPQATRVLTAAERQAFEILRTALPAHIVLAQVPLARFIKVPTRNSYAEWLRRAGHLSADLVVCDRHSQVVAVVRELGLPEARVNPNGGALALGHPLGATGARLVLTLLRELARSDGRFGLATLCVGGGMGAAMVLERTHRGR